MNSIVRCGFAFAGMCLISSSVYSLTPEELNRVIAPNSVLESVKRDMSASSDYRDFLSHNEDAREHLKVLTSYIKLSAKLVGDEASIVRMFNIANDGTATLNEFGSMYALHFSRFSSEINAIDGKLFASKEMTDVLNLMQWSRRYELSSPQIGIIDYLSNKKDLFNSINIIKLGDPLNSGKINVIVWTDRSSRKLQFMSVSGAICKDLLNYSKEIEVTVAVNRVFTLKISVTRVMT
ncbi:hypothetical protein I3271_03400 [Photobacterium leiognathi]|uniref:hypothetical protein n=1 Tax=Photobacterium leiognathi TaxID=553611 RepID=UPI001EDEC3A8|nr:hypothetical protein [Photobacterium leiognathi]MCG3883727.1 hypothetical protein [Photobacterium leiognathi]